MKIGKEIALEAKKKNLCAAWFKEMAKTNSVARLCEMFFAGSDWATENDFPTKQILKNFKGNSDQYGLLLDFTGEFKGEKGAFFGDSNVVVNAESAEVRQLYARHNTKIEINASTRAYVEINLYDDAQAIIRCSSTAKVVAYCYGKINNISSIGNGSVKVYKSEF